jgi:hypothetical protein
MSSKTENAASKKSNSRRSFKLDAHNNVDFMSLKPKLYLPNTTLNRVTYDGVNNYKKNHLDSLNANDISAVNSEKQITPAPRVISKEGFENYKKLTNRTFTFRKDSVLDGKALNKTDLFPNTSSRVTEEGKRNFYLNKGSLNIKQIFKNNNNNENTFKNEINSDLRAKENMSNLRGPLNNIYNGYGLNQNKEAFNPGMHYESGRSKGPNKGSADVKLKANNKIDEKATAISSEYTIGKNIIKTNPNIDDNNIIIPANIKAVSNSGYETEASVAAKESKDFKYKQLSSMHKILGSYGRNVTQEKFNPRVKNEAVENLNKSKGTYSETLNGETNEINQMRFQKEKNSKSSSMNKIFNEYGRNITKITFNPRVKTEARENYLKNRLVHIV